MVLITNSYGLKHLHLVHFYMFTTLTCVLLQVMEYVAAETVSAGMDGMEMHVKSGLARNILKQFHGGGWDLYFSRPLEHINATETMYNHH